MSALSVAVLVAVHVVASSGWWSPPVGSAGSSPTVVARFDPPAQPWQSGHRGVDLAARVGSPVRAAADGVVVYAGPLAGRGVVSIAHRGGLRSTYEPVRALVAVGSTVRRGALIGRVHRLTSAHPTCRTSCLHWGVRHGSRYLDPLTLLAPAQVRLLARPFVSSGRVQVSGTRMGLTVGGAQPIDRHVGVALGGGDRGVPEQLLNRAQVSTTLE